MDTKRLRNSIVILLIGAAVIALALNMLPAGGNRVVDEAPISDLIQYVRDGKIDKIVVEGDGVVTADRLDSPAGPPGEEEEHRQ